MRAVLDRATRSSLRHPWATVGLAVLAHARGGPELVSEGLRGGADLLVRFAPVIIVSFLAAGFAERLIPQEWVRERLDQDSGLVGILIGAGAGLITPGGPFVSMPIAAVMMRSGAGAGPVVAFLAAWSLLSIHRLVAWEVPILGWRFGSLGLLAALGPCLFALPATTLADGAQAANDTRAVPVPQGARRRKAQHAGGCCQRWRFLPIKLICYHFLYPLNFLGSIQDLLRTR